MPNKKAYMLYSVATDTTGQALANALEIDHGYELPGTKYDVFIMWGAKLQDDVQLPPGAAVLNHPKAINTNRNKFKAMTLMKESGRINIAPFADASEVLSQLEHGSPTIELPCVGRLNYHQGGEDFFLCLTKNHVKSFGEKLKSVFRKRGYFQKFIDSKKEYRIHVFQGKIIAAAEKTERQDLQQAYIKQQAEKLLGQAKKNDIQIDDRTLQFVLKEQAANLKTADPIVRSNTRGYKFAPVKTEAVPEEALRQACEAVHVLGLDFGAVDCAVDFNDKVWILEVNTGPGLEGTAFDSYVKSFKQVLSEGKNAQNKDDYAKEAPAPEMIDRGRVASAERLRLLADMMEVANDDEAAMINRLARKLFS